MPGVQQESSAVTACTQHSHAIDMMLSPAQPFYAAFISVALDGPYPSGRQRFCAVDDALCSAGQLSSCIDSHCRVLALPLASVDEVQTA